jgi:iron complex outermembrane recepter protein
MRPMIDSRALCCLLVGSLASLVSGAAAQSARPDKDLTALSLEELMKVNVSVTTAARRAQRLGDVASAVYVLTADDIKRAGARTIPDALRLVPGVQVAQIDANKWAVSARGFNSRFSNKLLVLMDGRTIYTPLFSGVIWDLNHYVPDDIERIEVIRGPGASLWGSNAVNGVINIITKSAKDTQGGLASLGAGTAERGFGSFRWGGKIGEGTHWRAGMQGLSRASLERNDSGGSPPSSLGGSFSFRLDSQAGPDAWHVNAGYNGGTTGETPIRYAFTTPYKTPFNNRARGDTAHVLGRWTHALSPGSDVQIQTYASRESAELHVVSALAQTFDLELQHRAKWGERHQFVWGGGYRLRETKLDGKGDFAFAPEERRTGVFSAFVQDEYSLIPNELRLTVGSRFEHHPFTGFNLQPNLRLSWTPSEQHMLWASVARAVRTPSIGERDTASAIADIATDRNTGLPIVFQNRPPSKVVSETVVAFEAGYRVRPWTRASIDVAAFYNVYNNLLGAQARASSVVVGPPTRIVVPLGSNYSTRGRTFGAEIATEWQPIDGLRLRSAYSLLRMDLESDEPNAIVDAASRNPRHQGFLHASYDFSPTIKLDGILRGATRLTSSTTVAVPGYVTMDARIAWQPSDRWELALVGTNLLGGERVEFVSDLIGLVPSRIGPTAYARATVRF